MHNLSKVAAGVAGTAGNRPTTYSGMLLKNKQHLPDVDQFRNHYQGTRRRRRYRVKRVMAKLKPKHPTLACGARLNGNSASGWRGPDNQTHVKGLYACNMVWACPVCAPRIQTRRREELAHALKQWRARSPQNRVVLVTFTTPHTRDMVAVETVRQLNAALKRFKKTYAFKAYSLTHLHGTIRALEITWSEANGWHPHHHQLDFLRQPIDDEIKTKLRAAWIAALRQEGLGQDSDDKHLERYALDFRDGDAAAAYITTAWELASMTTKQGAAGHYNAFEIIDHPTIPQWRKEALFVEYLDATHGRQQLTWSPQLKKNFLIEELNDDLAAERQKAADTAEAVKVCDFTPPQWKVIVRHDAEEEIHELIRTLPLETAQREIDRFIYNLSRLPPKNSDAVKYRVWKGTPSHQETTGELKAPV